MRPRALVSETASTERTASLRAAGGRASSLHSPLPKGAPRILGDAIQARFACLLSRKHSVATAARIMYAKLAGTQKRSSILIHT
jgi:hypothetical protein